MISAADPQIPAVFILIPRLSQIFGWEHWLDQVQADYNFQCNANIKCKRAQAFLNCLRTEIRKYWYNVQK